MFKAKQDTYIFVLALFILSMIIVAACSSTPYQESTGQYIDNSAITMQVKGHLIADPEVKGLPITVKTYKGIVMLSGFVDNEHQKHKAVFIARQVKGVVSVKDSLVVKKQLKNN